MVQTTNTGEQAAVASRGGSCHAAAKWAALVNDIAIPLPQQRVTPTLLRSQAAVGDGLALFRDHNSPNDPRIDDGVELDLAEGNVFYTVKRGDAAGRGDCHSPPKLAYFVDDHAEVTTNPDQNGRTLRELFGLDGASPLLRDFESPVDEPVGPDESAAFADGPVFFTRQVSPVLVIVNGKRRRVTGPQLTFDALVGLAFDPPPTGDLICFTITYRGGPCSNPEGSLLEGQSVTITDRMVFNVTATDKS